MTTQLTPPELSSRRTKSTDVQNIYRRTTLSIR